MAAGRAGSAVIDAAGSHSIYVSRPDVVADIIEQAARRIDLVAVSGT
jgi:hypothetical protein